MTKLRPALALALLSLVALTAGAQVVTTQPIKIETPQPKKVKFKGEVLHATRVAITVRSRDKTNLVRTFTYDVKLAAKIGKKFDENKLYQFGDRVEITHLAGTDTATKVSGKPGQNRSSGP